MDPDSSAGTSNLRPWSTLISPSTISLPLSLSDVTHRLSANLTHFHLNYINISLIALFISLLFHPFAVILFLLTTSAWYYYLINRGQNNPFVILDRTIEDRTILAVLGVVTVLALVLGNVWVNLFVSFLVSGFVVFVLAVVRVPVDDDDDSPYGSLLDNNNSPLGAYSHV